MVRTLMFAGLVTLFGATASEAQYRDSAPPEDQYDTEYETESTYDDSYDEELLGPREDREENRYDNRGYSEPDIDVGIFASLGNDGRWHFLANIGWVWRPYANAGWRPYSDGRWVWTSHGWTWVSYEPFGWATYHYGYWTRDPFLGWVWIPDYEWAACRVEWAYYDNYICWAPLPRPGYDCPRPWSAAGINVWFTVGANHFCDPYPVRYCVTPKYKQVYAERVAYKSPDRRFVERYTGAPVRTATVDFKHKSWSKGDSRAAKFESKDPSRVTARSRATRPETRKFSSPSVGKRTDRVAVKSKSSKQVMREFRAPERSTPRQAVKPQRVERESRVARAERPAKQVMKSHSAREQRSIQKPQRFMERTSRAAMQTSHRSSERKSVVTERKSTQRDVAKAKRSESNGKGRGKAR